MKLLDRLFHRHPLGELLQEQLEDAERNAALHLAAAEHHAALAGMYQGRVVRIRRQQAEAGGQLRAVK